MNATEINELSKRIYEQNKAVGWWDEPRSLQHCLSLVNSENGEAVNGARKNLMDDHLSDLLNEEVETADQLIRVLDLGGHCGFDYLDNFVPNTFFINGKAAIEAQFLIAREIVMLGEHPCSGHYTRLIDSIVAVAEYRGFNLWKTVDRKIEYNKTRADHKRENRAKPEGKKA